MVFRTGVPKAEHLTFLFWIEIALWSGKTLYCAGLVRSARLRSGSIRFGLGPYSRLCYRLDSKLGCIGSKPCSAWLEARLGSAQASDRLRLDSRLGTWLGTRLGSRPDSGSGTGSALFGNRLDSKRCSPRCLIRLDSGLTWGSKLARGSGWTRSSARSAGLGLSQGLARMILGLDSARFRSGISRQICNKYIYYIITSNKCVWSDAILPAPERG